MSLQVIYEVSHCISRYAASLLLPLGVAILEGNLTSIWAFSVTLLCCSLLPVCLMIRPKQGIQQALNVIFNTHINLVWDYLDLFYTLYSWL